MNKKWRFLLASLIVMIMASIIWVQPIKNDNEIIPSKELFTLKRSTPILNDFIRFGDEKGFFKEEGIKFDEVGIINSAESLPALLKGDIDFEVTHFRLVSQIARGVQVKAVIGRGNFTREGPHHRYLVLKDSRIKTAQDLVGKKIAVSCKNCCYDFYILEYMSQNGIDKPAEKVDLVVVPEPNFEQALKNGNVDVISPISGSWRNNNFRAKKALSEGWARELPINAYDVYGTEPNAPGWFFTEKFIGEHPDAVRGFVRGMFNTHQYINNNFKEYAEWISRKENISVDWVELPTIIGDGLITDEGVYIDTFAAVKQFGLRKEEYQNIKWSDTYTNQFNPNYKKLYNN